MSIGIAHFWIAFFGLGIGFTLEYVLFHRRRPALDLSGGGSLSERPWYGRYIYALLILFLLLAVLLNATTYKYQHFVHLAQSFLTGHLYLIDLPEGVGDTVAFGGHFYWPLGPFPAVMLMPLAWTANLLGVSLYQGVPQSLLIFGIVLLVRGTARSLGYTPYESTLWAFAFTFGTMFLGVGFLAESWYFAQVVATFLIWWALHEYQGRRRYLVLGMATGCLLATRITAALLLIFFLLDLIYNRELMWRQRLVAAARLLVPCLIVAVLIGLYNLARFANPVETGYTLQNIGGFLLATRRHGVFSLAHVPGNLYYALLSGPLPVPLGDGSQVLQFPFFVANRMGMSVFVTSPYMLLLFLLRYRDTVSRILLVTVVMIALPVILYYGIGYGQLGYRYALDFWPLLFLLFMRSYRQRWGRVTGRLQLAIVFTALANLYLYLTIFAVAHPLVAFP